MRMLTTGLAGLVIALGGVAPTFAQSVQDEIQESEAPGSEIEVDIGGGEAKIHREDGEPLLGLGGGGATELELPEGPTTTPDIDPVDDELPGEGPENLSGPFDEDPLPE